MWLELARRLSLILLIVAVATSMGVPQLQAGAQHDQAAVAMTADAPTGCAHDGCPIDQNAATHANCFATCAGVSLVSPPATGVIYLAVAHGILVPSGDRTMVDRGIPPDPHPPKQA